MAKASEKVAIGVLALQGDFAAHCAALRRAGALAREVRTAEQLRACDGLVVPGGESTTMLKLLGIENLFEPLRRFGQAKPIYGTCAGAILLAQAVTHPAQASLALVDIDVERNAYGRQVDSRIVAIGTEVGQLEAVFIRAPIIRRVGPGVRVLASYSGDPVWIEDGLHMVTTFHPELAENQVVHAHFVGMVERGQRGTGRMATAGGAINSALRGEADGEFVGGLGIDGEFQRQIALPL
jgi:pyridoxal 5'-phosphate synthase pdxT subunit